MLLAEELLMSTGLVTQPDRTHVTAATGMMKDTHREMREALVREDPGRLYVCPTYDTYFNKLTDEIDYEEWKQPILAKLGPEVADVWQVKHSEAREALKALRPKMEIDTIMGPVEMPLDFISRFTWALQVDVVEGLRLVKDIAAGALLKEEVDLFIALFPEAYKQLRATEDEMLAKQRAKDSKWFPPPWLEGSLNVFERRPFGSKLTMTSPKSAKDSLNPKPAVSNNGAKFDTESLTTSAKRVG